MHPPDDLPVLEILQRTFRNQPDAVDQGVSGHGNMYVSLRLPSGFDRTLRTIRGLGHHRRAAAIACSRSVTVPSICCS